MLRTLGYLLAVVTCVVALAEAGLRLEERLIWATGCVRCERGLIVMGQRLNLRLWGMFLRPGARDLRVLGRDQVDAVQLPPNGRWDAEEFLLPESMREQHRFLVRSDSLGFRGAAQNVPKGAREFRVLVLGSYQAFGHGVGDEEAYPSLLLRTLRESAVLRKRGLTPVVWNAGLQSASLEQGTGLLSRRGGELHPNVIVLDYGMTDQLARGFNPWVQPFAAFLDRGGLAYRLLTGLTFGHPTELIGSSYLFTQVVNREMERVLPMNRARWSGELEKLVTNLGERGVKVLLLDQPVAGIPAEAYREIAKRHRNVDFLSVAETLAETAPSAAQPDPDWLTEFPPAFRAYFRARVPFYAYLGSILHINARGHREVARRMAAWMERYGVDDSVLR